MTTYDTKAEAIAAMNRMKEKGLKLGIIRNYRIRAWVDFRPAEINKGVIYSVERFYSYKIKR